MAGSRVGLFDNLNIPIHRDAQHREDPPDTPRVKVSSKCQMNPGPYWPLSLWGFHLPVGGVNEPPSAKGEFKPPEGYPPR